jgi:hypothetical protein
MPESTRQKDKPQVYQVQEYLIRCEPTAHRFFPSDSASFRFWRFRPTAHRRVLCWPSPLLAILP